MSKRKVKTLIFSIVTGENTQHHSDISSVLLNNCLDRVSLLSTKRGPLPKLIKDLRKMDMDLFVLVLDHVTISEARALFFSLAPFVRVIFVYKVSGVEEFLEIAHDFRLPVQAVINLESEYEPFLDQVVSQVYSELYG